MDTFDHVLNWKLKRGSHSFPGPDGGTCINEAALVAAGFPYQPIRSVEKMPDCFSRPICRLALSLNDMADNQERQRLLPYVTRLACADTKKVEQARQAYICRHMGPHYYPYAGYDIYAGMNLSKVITCSFDRGLEVLEGALAIGRQADPLGLPEVQSRMDAARAGQGKSAKAAASEVAQSKAFFAKAKSWLTMKEKEPAGAA